MASTRTRSAEERTDKHRKTHKLVQTWVTPERKKEIDARCKSEGRTVANWLRHELDKIFGTVE